MQKTHVKGAKCVNLDVKGVEILCEMFSNRHDEGDITRALAHCHITSGVTCVEKDVVIKCL